MAQRTPKPDQAAQLPPPLKHVHLNAAGIDVGGESHYVAVPADRDPQPVRQFGCFTPDLYQLADWLEACGVDTVAMESTGVYWIPVFEVLEERGFEVKLVSPQQLRRAPRRKTDVLDCQWLQELHTFGLLSGAFRPEDQVCVLRSYVRQRGMLVRYAGQHIQHMQKALTQMNVQLQHAVSDITGVTGMGIVRAILAGERNPQKLATLREPGCKRDQATIAKALQGNWRPEHLFALQQAVELYDSYQQKIADCDQQILAQLHRFEDRSERGSGTPPPPRPEGRKLRKNQPTFDAAGEVYRITGVDLTKINAIQGNTALKVISEIGTDVRPWPNEKHFTSWLGLCPDNRSSGGKKLRQRKVPPNANRAAEALRIAARSLHRSSSALGAFLRRMKARVGMPKAIEATARKLAVQIYYMLKHGTDYVDRGQDYYERAYQDRVLKNLSSNARKLGYRLVKEEPASTQPQPA